MTPEELADVIEAQGRWVGADLCREIAAHLRRLAVLERERQILAADQVKRLTALERENARLREALDGAMWNRPGWREQAREALAGTDGA